MIHAALALLPLVLPASGEPDGARAAADWPDYRGPTWDGHVRGGSLPLRWSEQENVTWKTRIPGRGWSTPVIERRRLHMTTATEDGTRLFAVCVDSDSGRILGERLVFEVEDPEEIHPLNSYASPSPCVGDGVVFVHFGTYGTACLDADTLEVVWTRDDLHIDHIVGPGSSPVLVGDLLIVHMDGGDRQFVIAFDARDGSTRWRTDRSADLKRLEPDLRKSYETPILVESDDGPELLSVGAEAVYGYEIQTGRERWRVRFSGFSQSSRAVAGGGLVYVNTGFNTPHLLAVRLGGRGDVTSSHVAWVYKSNVPTMSSPILHDGLLFFCSENGIFTCLDASTGERRFRRRVGGEYSASPILSEGRIYFPSRDGRCFVIAAKPEFELLAENRLDDGFMASPAVSGNALFLRSKTHLYRIEESGGEPEEGGR